MWCPRPWKVGHEPSQMASQIPSQIPSQILWQPQPKLTYVIFVLSRCLSPTYRRHDTINVHCPMFALWWQQKTQCDHHCPRDAGTCYLGQQTIFYFTRGHQTTRKIANACRCTQATYPGVDSHVCTYEGILDGHYCWYPVSHALHQAFFYSSFSSTLFILLLPFPPLLFAVIWTTHEMGCYLRALFSGQSDAYTENVSSS